ncbi:MAG: hypothetical protein Q7R54_01245 [bacterium]|nr:hypothetical protein [bacterium]
MPRSVLDLRRRYLEKKQFAKWRRSGCPIPPPHVVKQYAIAEYQKTYGCQILVETGTYRGDMVEAQKKRFKKIISIELGVDLFEKAQERFRNDANVVIVQGDSGRVLPEIVREIHEPAVFWLDGHYSGGITAKGNKESPIFEELDAIFSTKNSNHILLIDDARCFTGEGSYPTIGQLIEYIRSKNETYEVEVKHDIIRCVGRG